MIRSFPPSPLTALMSIALAAAIAGCATPGGSAPAASAPAAKAAAAPDAAKLPVMLVYGDKGAVQPYTLFLGTPANFSTTVPQNGTGSLDAGAIKIEPAKVGDAPGAKFTWTGGLGQFHLQSKMTNDLLDYIDADSAMVFDAVVNKSPEDQVTMRVDCRYPCLGVVDMTDFYKKAPVGQTIQVKVPLTCFEATGTKFTAVNTPLVIFTTKPFSLSVANVRYVPGAAKDADAFKCAA
ncbi:putative glycoside hydrolase [Piscinibacter sp.]|uniref:putative glycoside hydrolase n=1 Tax=Piscinibacter sp. TaxID=1903157 RepID=UPI002D1C0903|nr:putative glycoside hydrolase [Albitalea sp.]HUG23445.1 putative glycoside hydrolase [Albitalea sp.]